MCRLTLRTSLQALAASMILLACAREPHRPVVYPTPVYGTGAPGQQPAQPNPPGAYPPAPAPTLPPAAPATAPLPQVASDPINNLDVGFLRGRAVAVLGELVAALPAPQQARVRGIPLITDSTVGEVNAFATCTRDGKATMAITDGLLDIQAHMAQARAIDELFGGQTVQNYVQYIAQNQRPKMPIVKPPPGMFNPAYSLDGRKVARQHELLDEQIAFVLGHELAHHYLGHLPCTGGSGLTAAEVGRVLSEAIPVFNQGYELGADMAGVNNVLTAGASRQGYRYTEGGALLTMQFFSGVDQFSPLDILFGFERSHPPPALRSPVIQQTAASWRSTGGKGLPILSF